MTFRRLAIAALAVPLFAGCVSNETLGTRPTPAGGPLFSSYVALGTSIAAGVQSAGINDSTQKQAYPYLLATAMGLTPGVNWQYPKLSMPGCPPPYDNILTSHRIAVVPGGCALRDPTAAAPYENNLGIPSIRVAQLLDLTRRDFVKTDTLALAQFITGSVNPVDMMTAAHPTFVTLEIGWNDVLGAATRSDTNLLTAIDTFKLYFGRVEDRIDATGAKVAVANVPNVTRVPYFSMGLIFYCLKNGCAAPLPPATLPFSLPTFTVDASCVPSALGGVGDSTFVNFPTTGAIAGVLAGGGAASLNCATGAATATGVPAAALPVLVKSEVIAIAARAAAMNAFIATEATARGYALVNVDSTLAANAASIPAFPNLTSPATLMGTLFSQDGVHPTAAGHVILATAFKTAINRAFGTGL